MAVIPYPFDALKTLILRARQEPFIFLAAAATVIYAAFAYRQWQVMSGQLDEMQADRRPWISLDPEIAAVLAGPLAFDDNGAHVKMNVRMGNVGHAPAHSVFFDAVVIPWAGTVDAADRVIEQRDAICLESRKRVPTKFNSGFVIFQSQSISIQTSVKMSIGDVSVWKTQLADKRYQLPVVTGCIDYTFTSSDDYHTTRFIFELDRLSPQRWTRIDPTAGDVPAGDLVLSGNPYLPWKAD